MTEDEQPFMTSAETAAKFQVNQKTVERWAREGRFPRGAFTRTLGGHGHYRFRRAVIDAMLAEPEGEPRAED